MMLRKVLTSGLVSILASVLFLGCGKYDEKQQGNESSEVAALNTKKVTLDVQGMTCSGCEYNVESALNKIDGVAEVKADYASNSAQVEFDPKRASLDQLIVAVNESGYKAKAPKIQLTQ